jgi:hypothetical protein
VKYAAVNRRTRPFADGTSVTELIIEVAGGGWLDLLSKVTWDIGMARGFPDDRPDLAIGVAEREGYTVVNK